MAVAMVCFVFMACNDGKKAEGSKAATKYHSGTEYATADYEDVKKEIKYEDNKSMTKLMKDITAGKYDNKVVEMDGINTRYG